MVLCRMDGIVFGTWWCGGEHPKALLLGCISSLIPSIALAGKNAGGVVFVATFCWGFGLWKPSPGVFMHGVVLTWVKSWWFSFLFVLAASCVFFLSYPFHELLVICCLGGRKRERGKKREQLIPHLVSHCAVHCCSVHRAWIILCFTKVIMLVMLSSTFIWGVYLGGA